MKRKRKMCANKTNKYNNSDYAHIKQLRLRQKRHVQIKSS